MKSIKLIYIYLIVVLFSVVSSAYSEDTIQTFKIQKGVVTITPGFCPPNSCPKTTATLSGTFSAVLAGDKIALANVSISTVPETGFILPQAPNENSGGTVRSATFSFDGIRLVMSGIVDSRAFDGPLYEYEFAAQVSNALGFDAKGYYTARRDFRKCISPLCGGIFVKSVNKRFTKCADGTLQNECYVASANWEELGFDPFNTEADIFISTPILLKGKLIPYIYGGFGNLGEFVGAEAYRPATNNPAEGIFAALQNNSIVCITTPCFSIDEYILNTRKVKVISSFDLNPVGASDEDLSIAYSLFSNNSPLIVTGHNEKLQELHGIGISFIANQLYLPIRPSIQPCGNEYSPVNSKCTTE